MPSMEDYSLDDLREVRANILEELEREEDEVIRNFFLEELQRVEERIKELESLPPDQLYRYSDED